MKYNKIVIGVDQSYTRTGLSIIADGKPMHVTSLDFKGLQSKSEKRLHLRQVLVRLIPKMLKKASEVLIICERVRTFSASFGSKKKGGNDQGLNPKFLMMTGALVCTIVDTAAELGVKTYSVDTRAWKSKIIGSSKAKVGKDGKRDSKSETVEFVQKLGIDLFLREKKSGKNKGEKIFDDDAADSCCIGLYGFISPKLQNLNLEE